MTLLGDSDLSEGEAERIRAMLEKVRGEKKWEEQVMNLLSKFCPSDAFVLLTANVLVQIAVVVALAAAISLLSPGIVRPCVMRFGLPRWLRAAKPSGGVCRGQDRLAIGFAAVVASFHGQ